ncbi:PREDICTED: leucine-rich PPR motif-containing protein, mitochondrial [Nicrophorus vespilloides]|uniref:Leucine-rich PPR motif-containing protein, mitochondrial n=1 Tax=Nicrophorus vespilloides TaxID=110193 RepID=A0ABM1NA82_NICVS|nr:PREDICTED: leucine-rich PPR motif-containing protein, mitochondrial [Nicrophorus vespilloides]
MASILRSSKFVRYIAGFARNIVANTPREFDGNFINTSQCLCGALPRSFATQVSAQHEQNLDSCLRRLDQDVRRSGRISRRDIEDVLEEIRNARSATSSQSLLVIRCCGNLVPEELPETRTKLVQEIWNTLKKLNVPMDISHYNALLRVYLENEYNFSPTDFLAELESKGIEPNRVTYQRLISQYCNIGDIEGATRILEFMREKQLPVNENVFNALINGHSQTGDMESARGIITVMSQAGLEPSADTYTTLLCGFAKVGDMNTINELYAECETKEIYLLDKDFLDIIYTLSTNGHEQHVPEVLSKTRKAFGYSQDAINVILRLINKGLIETAYLIQQSIPRLNKADGSVQPIGAFFIKQMVKTGASFEEIIEVVDKLEKDGLYDRGLTHATECALQQGNDELTVKLFHQMKSKGLPIRQHYFWPLIIAKSGDRSGEGILNVLNEMISFGIQPNNETIREYVIPNLQGKSSDIISKLRIANISIGSAASSLVLSLLHKFDIVEASIITQTVEAYYNPDMIKKPLTAAFYKTGNVDAYVSIVRQVFENMDKKAELEIEGSVDKIEVVGILLFDLATHSRQFSSIAEQVFKSMVNEGLTISTVTAQKLEEKLGEKMTPEMSKMLGSLSSGELTLKPFERKYPSYTPSHQMNIPQLERLVQNLEAKKQDTKGYKRQLLSLYYRQKELEKMQALYKSFEQDPDFKYTTGVYAQLMDTCAYHEKFDEMKHYLAKIQENDSQFEIDESKLIRLVTVFVKNNEMDTALEFLKRPRERKTEERSYNYNSLCWRLLNYLAEQGKTQELQQVFDAMTQNDLLDISNVTLGPLIKVHLVNNDLNAALDKFEWCCKQFKATPWKNDLACKLIQNEDAENLQKLTDLSTSVHGEINSLYDLVFAFVECGRIRQARKILETPGLQNRPQRINLACQRYQQEGLVKPLEGLRDATKDLNHIDRTDIYYQLLLSYIKQVDTDKAISLWTQMQEEDISASDQFLITLGKFLKNNNVEVPFLIPEQPKKQTKLIKTPQPVQVPAATPKKDLTVFRQVLKSADVDKAMEIKKNSNENFTVTDISLLIEKLVQNDRQLEATKLTEEMLTKQQVPITRVFRFLLNKLANSGDFQAIERIGKHLDCETKKIVSFDNRICHANLVAGKAEDYLLKLETEIDNANESDLTVIGEKFPRGGAVGILERHPELLEKYENVAIKYAKRGIIAPVNVLWSHYFINNNEAKATEVWNTHMQGAPRIMFQRVVQHARGTNDENLTAKLIEHLKTSKVTEGALGNAYSCLLDVLVNKEKHEEVIENFEEAIKTVPLDNINRTAILRVKESYEKLNKPFNHTIPAKSNKSQTSTSSSSSSDDDVSKQKH